MRSATGELERFLDELSRGARPGDRVPTVRELMRRFGASQMVVQRAFEELRSRGVIESHVGRGTFFRSAGTMAPAPRAGGGGDRARAASGVKSVLLLRRSISIARGRLLVEGLQRRFAGDGHRVLELSYTDPDHALSVLRGLPRFDAALVQSTYRIIPVEMLAALRQKSDVLAVDGAALVGSDVEAVGTEWGEPLAEAVRRLAGLGHQRIAFSTTDAPLLATVLARRRFEHMPSHPAGPELHPITIPRLPDEDYAALLVDRLRADLRSGAPSFTALVAWGIEDGAGFLRRLADIGVDVPGRLSVVLLGRTDLANEHADFFDVVGCSVADQIDALHRAVTARWADPQRPYGVVLTPVRQREGRSTAPPPKTPERRAQR